MKLKLKKEMITNQVKWIQTRKKKTKILIAGGMVIVVAAVSIYSFGFRGRNSDMAAAMSVMNAKAEKGNLSTTIEGTGTLAAANTSDLKLPTGVEIKKVKVSVGDEVKKGDTLATVDGTSLTAQLLAIQEELEDVNSQISEEAENDTTKYVTSSVDGRIKKIYAKKNTDVGTTILDKGALMLVSLDGKMAVDLETSVNVKVGQTVDVTLSDGSSISGTVVKAGDDSCTVTVTDNGTGYKEGVTVQTTGGKTIGSGKLYINKEAKITATSGVVKQILVSENESVSEGESLLKLKGDFQSATYLSLEAEKESLEEQLEVLLKIAQNNTITADEDGIVTAVNVSDSEEAQSGTSETETDSTTSNTETGMVQTSTKSMGTSGSGGIISLSTVTSSATESTMAESTGTEATTTKDTATTEQSATTEDTSTTEQSATTEESGTTEQSATTEQENQDQINTISDLGKVSVTAPEAGKKPETTVSGTGYEGTVTWNPADDSFQAGTSYQAKVKLTAAKAIHLQKIQPLQ